MGVLNEEVMALINDIKNKVINEYKEFITEMKTKDQTFLVENCYKICCMQNIVTIFENESLDILGVLSEDKLQAILNCPSLLEWVYERWLHHEDSFYEELTYSITETIRHRLIPSATTAKFD